VTVNEQVLRQLDAFSTPGTMLRVARQELGMSEREVAERLNLLPEYVGFLERDEYDALRSPAFARGYVRSYGRLLGVDEQPLLHLFDEMRAEHGALTPRRIQTRPLQLQRTGLGVVTGLVVLLLLVFLLWWWQGGSTQQAGYQDPTVDIQPAGIAVSAGGTGGL
tara:strand:+ start:2192 stop:2683 length:492 start_codon:yes stop_codon:yes gene_type:complete